MLVCVGTTQVTYLRFYTHFVKCYFLLLDRHIVASLCPVVGKRWAQIVNGACPKEAQNPNGKELNISFIGPPPLITYKPVGGSEFLLMRLLAQKLNFRPKFISERSYDIVNDNGTFYGMVHRVGDIICQFARALLLICLGFDKAK